ncbi:hypothetical protein FACS1894217_11830 [Clostridia bacterium]|nr:hypothetical protein FACS1894217_11830 [Clostridia bacterium]
MSKNIPDKLARLANSAARVKSDTSKRHIPNAHDLYVASEHSHMTELAQYQTIKHEGNVL